VVDVGQAEAEVAAEVLAIELQLALDLLHARDVVGEKAEADAHRLPGPREDARRDAERVAELEAQPLALVERGRQIRLERGDAARGERRLVARLAGEKGVPRGHREDLGTPSEERPGLLAHEAEDLLAIGVADED